MHMEMDTIITGPICEAPALFEVPIMGERFVVTLWMQAQSVSPTEYRLTCVETGDFIVLDAGEEITYLRPATVAEETETYLALHDMGLID